jgi:signal transduction histidine kinase
MVVEQAIHQHGDDQEKVVRFQKPKVAISAELVVGDFQRVVINLIDNALYSVREKMKINQAHKPEVTLEVQEEGEHVILTITDNGMGIATENLPQLGTPFFTTKPPGKGTGLGLSICHDIIDTIHQGSIDIQSTEGEYARIRITIPKTKADSP